MSAWRLASWCSSEPCWQLSRLVRAWRNDFDCRKPPGSGASRRMPLAGSRASGSSNESPRSDHRMVQLMVAKNLLIVTALVETGAGVLLLVSPRLVVVLLLGASPDTTAALVVARIAGAALLSLGCACWLARNDGSNGLVAAMLLYNTVAIAVLANAGVGTSLVGTLTWPTIAL